MDVVRGIDSLAPRGGPAAVTVGFFDGVHRGHQAVIGRTVEAARGRRLVPVAMTFDRHPREVLIAALGVEALVVLEFTRELSEWPPEAFVRRVLLEGLRAKHAVVGSNFTFGHQAAGNLATLAELGAASGMTTEGMPLLSIDGRNVSSSSIREALAAGDLDWPERALGRRFVLDGVVVPGAGRGAGLGFPTANLEVSPRLLLPAQGVYAGKALTAEGERSAAINVGTNPTFGREPVHVEAFLLDFEGDLLGRPVALEFWARLREEVRFDSPEALARQIGEDVERTRDLVGRAETAR